MINWKASLAPVSLLLAVACHFTALAEPVAKNCAGLLSSDPEFSRSIRKFLSHDLSPISQTTLLPQTVLLIEKDSLHEMDVQAITASLKNSHKEVTFYEALDHEGKVILRTEILVGENAAIDSGELFFELLEKIEAMGLERAERPVAKIRSSHTHPPRHHKFSFADTNSLFVRHAVLEAIGGNEIELEESILFLDFSISESFSSLIGNSPNRIPYTKRTLRIPPGALSFENRDYSIGRSLDEKLLNIMKTRSVLSTYSPSKVLGK